MHMLTMLDLDADLFADNVLAYEDPGQQYVIIQYSMVTKPNSNILIGQFQIYLFSNGDIGYIYNNVYASPESKGRNALIGEPCAGLQHMCSCRWLRTWRARASNSHAAGASRVARHMSAAAMHAIVAVGIGALRPFQLKR